MRKVAKFLLIVLATVVVLAVALPFAVPPIASRMAMEKLEEKYGFASDVRMSLGYCWRNGPGVKASVDAAVPGTPWRVSADVAASCCEWSAHVAVPEARFSEQDPLLAKLLEAHRIPDVSNLVFSGSVRLEATAERTFSKPVAEWRAKATVRDVDVRCERAGRPLSVSGVSLAPEAYGIADHVDVRPLVLKAASVGAAGVVMTNLRATVHVNERALMVSEARAGFLDGTVSAYSVFLDPKTLNAGLTLFLDDVDAGEALRHVKGFRGDASGRLHGKVRLFVREGGKLLRLSDAFLYSTPGESGKLRVRDKEALSDELAYAGLDEATRRNVAEALTDLDYNVLRMDIRRLEGTAARLTVRVGGKATRGKTSAPVDITINLNGELEQLINTGLGLSSKLKGKK